MHTHRAQSHDESVTCQPTVTRVCTLRSKRALAAKGRQSSGQPKHLEDGVGGEAHVASVTGLGEYALQRVPEHRIVEGVRLHRHAARRLQRHLHLVQPHLRGEETLPLSKVPCSEQIAFGFV